MFADSLRAGSGWSNLILPASWQQLGVNTTKYCKYSQVLLIMGENIDRNM
jgi:hypothetical protein